MLRISLAEVRAHIGRLIASCVAIIIAIGFVVATLVLSDTTRATVLKAVGARYVDVAAVVAPGIGAPDEVTVATSPEPAPAGDIQDFLDAVAGLEGVEAVSADTETFAQIGVPGRSGAQYASIESIAPEPALQWQDLASGRLPRDRAEVAASTRLGVEVGDTLTVTTYPGPTGPIATSGKAGQSGGVTEQVTVVGVIDLGADPTGDVQGRLFATPPQVAQWGGIAPTEVRIATVPGTDIDTLLAGVQAQLDEHGFFGTIRTGEQAAEDRAAAFTGEAADLTAILLVFAGVALLIAGMVIVNTFSVLLAQRTRELALLRCVGASTHQVRRGVLIEAAITGLGASAIGVVTGIGLAALTSRLLSQAGGAIPLEGLSVPLASVLVGLGLGTMVTVLAAVFPAAAATRVAPVSALRPSDQAPIRSRRGLLSLLGGLLLFLPGVGVLLYAVQIGDPLLAVAGGGLSALGTLMLLQRILPPVVAFAGRGVARLGGLPAALAAGNASRNPRRTAATATALLIGVCLTTAMIVGASSTRATANAELLASYPTDVIVSDFGEALPESLLGQLVAVQGVATGTGLLRTDVVGPDGQPWPAFGIDPTQGLATARSASGGVPSAGEVSIALYIADYWGVATGDSVTLSVDARSVTLTVEVNDAAQTITMPAADLRGLNPEAGIGQIWLRLDDDLDSAAVGRTVDDITDVAGQAVPTAEVTGIVALRAALNDILDTLLLVVTALLGVAVVIALIGVGNTLALSVIERRQENGLMRALGLTRGQLRGLLAWEALLVAGVAAVLGIVAGAAYGLAGTAAILGQVGDVVLDIPWLQIAAVVAIATAAGVLASVLPARRAARISPVAAIAG